MKKINNQRALKIIRSLRQHRQKQSQQIDIICRDMVTAHCDFAAKLAGMVDAAGFYEKLLSCSTLSETLDAAIWHIEQRIDSSSAVVFLAEENGFEIYSTSKCPTDIRTQFENWFTKELVYNISLSPCVCSLNKMLQMGLQGLPAVLKGISAAAIPLSRYGSAAGFILVYRSSEKPIAVGELASVLNISSGLSNAILNFHSGVKQHI